MCRALIVTLPNTCTAITPGGTSLSPSEGRGVFGDATAPLRDLPPQHRLRLAVVNATINVVGSCPSRGFAVGRGLIAGRLASLGEFCPI